MRRILLLPFEPGSEIDAVEVRGAFHPGQRGAGGKDLHGADGMLKRQSGRENARVSCDEGDMDAALVHRSFVVSQRQVLAAVSGWPRWSAKDKGTVFRFGPRTRQRAGSDSPGY